MIVTVIVILMLIVLVIRDGDNDSDWDCERCDSDEGQLGPSEEQEQQTRREDMDGVLGQQRQE